MRLLLDENCGGRRLVGQLRCAGRDVATIVGALGGGTSDAAIAAFAVQEDRVVVTKDAEDFRMIFACRPINPGLLVVYDDTVNRELSRDAIVRATAHFAEIDESVQSMILCVNDFQWQ